MLHIQATEPKLLPKRKRPRKLKTIQLCKIAVTTYLVLLLITIFTYYSLSSSRARWPPYLVTLHNKVTMEVCAGSLITRNMVLTAAHCVATDAEYLEISLGTDSMLGLMYRIDALPKDIFIHHSYQANKATNSIALVKIAPVPLTRYVRTLELPKPISSDEVVQTGTIYGWQITGTNLYGLVKQVVRKSVRMFDNIICHHVYNEGSNASLDNSNVCFYFTGRSVFCASDDGAPIVVGGVQVGMVVMGQRYCERNVPNVGIRIDYFLNWINKCIYITS